MQINVVFVKNWLNVKLRRRYGLTKERAGTRRRVCGISEVTFNPHIAINEVDKEARKVGQVGKDK